MVESNDLPTLYTSRYFNDDLLESGEVIPVGISMEPPIIPLSYDIIDGPDFLKPTYEMMRVGEWSMYSPFFLVSLERIGIENVSEWLKQASRWHDNKPVALLCR